MSLSDVKLTLSAKLASRPDSHSFSSDAELDIASSVVHQRYMYLCSLREKLGGSAEKVIEYITARDLRLQKDHVSVNSIHIQTFIPPSSNTLFNGLCPLPTRVDLLTGGVTVHPDYVGESDLTEEHIECVPLEGDMRDEPKAVPSSLEFVLKKIRIK